jgi:AcrR family transcriptional regulator
MRKQEVRTIISRRDRPAKEPLSRDSIASAALDILLREGLSKLSLRRVAAKLDTGAASLYVYVENISELYGLILDQALVSVELPEEKSSPWRDRIKTLLLSYFDVLVRGPGLAQLALSTFSPGYNALRICECLLGLLKEGGVDDKRQDWGGDMLLLYITASAAEESKWREAGESTNRLRDALRSLSEDEFPLVSALSMATRYGERHKRAALALDAMIDGILASPIRTELTEVNDHTNA